MADRKVVHVIPEPGPTSEISCQTQQTMQGAEPGKATLLAKATYQPPIGNSMSVVWNLRDIDVPAYFRKLAKEFHEACLVEMKRKLGFTEEEESEKAEK